MVGGGRHNRASGYNSVVAGGGGLTLADSNSASGSYSTVPGGSHNSASGDYSFAAGRRAHANHDGTFVWASGSDATFASTNRNQFLIRAPGGVGIGVDNPGRELHVGGSVIIDTGNDSGATALDVLSGAFKYGTFMGLQTTQRLYSGSRMLQISVAPSPDPNSRYIECMEGNNRDFIVWGNGNVTATGTITGGGADIAEMFAVSTGARSVEPGDVMVIDPANLRALTQSAAARSTLVAGIYSTAPGFLASEHDWDQVARENGLIASVEPGEEEAAIPVMEVAAAIGEIPLAVVGIVPCKVTAENGAITPGDLLVTSSTPGHAMRDDDPKNGTIVGKALGTLELGSGTIDVLVTLQ